MENERKNLIVSFPGAGYTVDKPLLYYANYKYYIKGYKNLKINYGDWRKADKSFDESIEDIKKIALNQVGEIDFSAYDDVVFVSKSLGTIIAGWLAETLNEKNIRHIYLTPIEKTLQFIQSEKNISIVIAGTKDNLMNTDILKEHCELKKVRLELIENADHSLEIVGDINANIDIMKRLVELY